MIDIFTGIFVRMLNKPPVNWTEILFALNETTGGGGVVVGVAEGLGAGELLLGGVLLLLGADVYV